MLLLVWCLAETSASSIEHSSRFRTLQNFNSFVNSAEAMKMWLKRRYRYDKQDPRTLKKSVEKIRFFSLIGKVALAQKLKYT